MTKSILLLGLFLIQIQAQNLVDCNQIFEARKGEILEQMDKLDQKQEEFDTYKDAKLKLIRQREKELDKRQDEVEQILQKAKKLNSEAKELKEQNKQILKNIKQAKEDKISKTYMKMRDSKAAGILDAMDTKKAAKILFGLKASKISKILAKMNPKNAATITNLLDDNKAFAEDK